MGPLLFSGKTLQGDQQSDESEQRKRKLCGCRGIGSTEPEVINPGGESRHRKKLDGAEIGQGFHQCEADSHGHRRTCHRQGDFPKTVPRPVPEDTACFRERR